jgi:hypothetical protein
MKHLKKVVATVAVMLLAVFVYAIPSPPTASFNVVYDTSLDPGVTYRVYLGTATRTYSTNWSVGTNLSVAINNVPRGATYFVAITSIDPATSLESDYSNEASYFAARVPGPPRNVRIP